MFGDEYGRRDTKIRKDPFDRLLISTALVEGLTIITGGVSPLFPVLTLPQRQDKIITNSVSYRKFLVT